MLIWLANRPLHCSPGCERLPLVITVEGKEVEGWVKQGCWIQHWWWAERKEGVARLEFRPPPRPPRSWRALGRAAQTLSRTRPCRRSPYDDVLPLSISCTSCAKPTVAQLLATLGITKSHSRPHVSDDNPFSASQFKTLKYRPEFPARFASHEHALEFCGRFFHWQNHEHHHWGLGLLTPATVHFGQAERVLAARQAVLSVAHAAHPERFVQHAPRPLPLPPEVWINPPADRPEPRMLQLPRDTNFVPQLSQTG